MKLKLSNFGKKYHGFVAVTTLKAIKVINKEQGACHKCGRGVRNYYKLKDLRRVCGYCVSELAKKAKYHW